MSRYKPVSTVQYVCVQGIRRHVTNLRAIHKHPRSFESHLGVARNRVIDGAPNVITRPEEDVNADGPRKRMNVEHIEVD